MSIFDNEKDQFDNIDETVAGNSLKEIMDFMSYIPNDIFYNSFTEQNWKDIEKYTDTKKRESYPWTYETQYSYYIELNTTFYHIIPYISDLKKFNYIETYTQQSNIRCARLELIRKGNMFYICPNFVRWPIVIENCGLDELPKSIRFAKKNPNSKSPLTFIIRADGKSIKWIDDLPKGSIVYILSSAYFTISKWEKRNSNGLDFFKCKEFDEFLKSYGQKRVIGIK